MDDDFIVPTFVVFDKTMAALGHRDDVRAGASDAAVLTVAVVAAQYFQRHLARAVQVLHRGRYLSGPLSASRFNRLCWPFGISVRVERHFAVASGRDTRRERGSNGCRALVAGTR